MLKLTIQQRLREPFLDQPMVCFDGLVAVVRRLHRSRLAVTVSTVCRLHFSNQLGPFTDLLPAVLKRKPQRHTHKPQNDAIDFHPFSCLTGFPRKVTLEFLAAASPQPDRSKALVERGSCSGGATCL